MKNVSSASLIFFCLTASASALDLTADPALTGAAPILTPTASAPVAQTASITPRRPRLLP